MRYSALFGKTLREPPKDEVSTNARLLEQGGFIAKEMAGVYTYLPLGVRVLDRICTIIREEMNSLGAQEVYMPALQPRESWDITGRWESLADIMYQFQDHSGRDIGLATTHEEVVTTLAKMHIHSYRDVPFAVYQIQDKFRDEPRAKSGLVRGREFSMKDLYSFHADDADCVAFYNRVAEAYLKIFSRTGLSALMIEASGGSFTKEYSHEFQVVAEAGEDRLLHCSRGDFAQNIEIATLKAGMPCPRCSTPLSESKGIEVGNIFKLGTRFSERIGATYADASGHDVPLVMASYGIGPGRLMGTVVETHHDEQGIAWPKSITPYHIHLVSVQTTDDVVARAEHLERDLEKRGLSVLHDDRDVRAGVKFADADLIGIPIRIVVSAKSADTVEVKERTGEEPQHLTPAQALTFVQQYYQPAHA